MIIIHDYIYDKWNDEGIIEDEETIQEALDGRITYDESLNLPYVVENFIRTVRREEGVILWKESSRS